MARKERVGVIVSDKMLKTIIVVIQKRYKHPKYGKILLKTKRFMAHDEANTGRIGDIVLLEESAPYSRNKKWRLKQILKIFNG